MNDKILKATYGSPDRPLRIGDLEIPCYVLEDGRRVLTQRGMIGALGMSRGGGSKHGGDRLTQFVLGKPINPFISNDLTAAINFPITFLPARGGRSAYGYEATILSDICDAVLAARAQGQLNSTFGVAAAKRCEILVRGFARIGIIALVDEATGYQEVRDRDALHAILDKYLRAEFAAWAKRFPDEFYEQIFRLKGWPWRGMSINRPSVVGHYTNDLVWDRLAPGIRKELQTRNPKSEKGYRKTKHHQWLTEDIGHPALTQHIHALMGLMRASTTWDQFHRLLQRAFPKKGATLEMPLEESDA